MNAAQAPVLMIGMNRPFIEAVEAFLPRAGLLVVESEEGFARRGLEDFVRTHPVIDAVVKFPYQDQHAVRSGSLDRLLPGTLRCVVPGLEYAVRAAGELAYRHHLPGAGRQAASILQDKSALRERLDGSVFSLPAARVGAPEQVRLFLARHPGGIVLKPTGQQGCLGVTRVHQACEVDLAWERLVTTGDVQLDPSGGKVAAMVEATARGVQVSTEVLVRNGQRLFTNITDVSVLAGSQPILTGHAVPSVLTTSYGGLIGSAIDDLVARVGFGTGMLHAELMVDQDADRVMIIECAGRPPGDRVIDLIDSIYGINLHLSLVELLSGNEPALPPAPVGAAAVRFLLPSDDRDVLEVAPPTNPPAGAEFQVALSHRAAGSVNSSFDRLASVLVRGESTAEAVRVAEKLLAAFTLTSAASDPLSTKEADHDHVDHRAEDLDDHRRTA